VSLIGRLVEGWFRFPLLVEGREFGFGGKSGTLPVVSRTSVTEPKMKI
jgi:hypothetical protein